MSIIVIILFVFAVICFYQIPPLVENKYWKELVAFSVFLLLAFIFTLMRGLGAELPNPNEGAEIIIKFIAGGL